MCLFARALKVMLVTSVVASTNRADHHLLIPRALQGLVSKFPASLALGHHRLGCEADCLGLLPKEAKGSSNKLRGFRAINVNESKGDRPMSGQEGNVSLVPMWGVNKYDVRESGIVSQFPDKFLPVRKGVIWAANNWDPINQDMGVPMLRDKEAAQCEQAKNDRTETIYLVIRDLASKGQNKVLVLLQPPVPREQRKGWTGSAICLQDGCAESPGEGTCIWSAALKVNHIRILDHSVLCLGGDAGDMWVTRVCRHG